MITATVLYILFILAFIVHDGEEIAVQHKWVVAHGDVLSARFPMLRHLFSYLRQLNTKAFAIAALEELVLLIVVTVYALIGGPYVIDLWSAIFIAFAIHLIVHILQAIVIRGYVPGLISSILLSPLSYLGMQNICNTFNASQLLLYGVIGVVMMMANLAFAHWLGMKTAKNKRQ